MQSPFLARSGTEDTDDYFLTLGGSTQITWMIARNGNVQTSPRGSFSFPYGAAAMTRRLAEADKQGHSAREDLAEEMKSSFRKAFEELEIPKELLQMAESEGGYPLYLSGGGFRGWGYLLMSQSNIQPYPIPIINGFRVDVSAFRNTLEIQNVASTERVFRVSQRRASQVPAVAFLVNVLIDALPQIKSIHFCQGGVREGYFYNSVGAFIRAQPPLPAVTAVGAPQSAWQLANLLSNAFPEADPATSHLSFPSSFDRSIFVSVANMLFSHASHPKETASLSAIYAPITGKLASAHGISHKTRALLSLTLCERWDGELPPGHINFRSQLSQLLTGQELWWTHYLGRVASLIAEFYPAGVVCEKRLELKAHWENISLKKGTEMGIKLDIQLENTESGLEAETYMDAIAAIEKLGKRKNRSGGEKGIGVPVEVELYGMNRIQEESTSE